MSGRSFANIAAVVTSITVLSRVLGLAREALVAKTFGAGPETDAFFVAFQLPDVVFNSLLGFLVATCFVPVFATTRAKSDEAAMGIARSAYSLLVVLLLLLTAFAMIGAAPFIRLIAPGLTGPTFRLSVQMARIMMPIMVLGGLGGLGKSILNSMNHFAIPAAMPVVFNIVVILSIVLLGASFGIKAMAWGVLAGAFGQTVLLLPALRRVGLSFRPEFPTFAPPIRQIGVLAAPVLTGLVLGQAMQFVTIFFASDLGEGAVSYLSYARRLFSMPEQMFLVIVISLLFPMLSGSAARGDWVQMTNALSRGLRLTAFAMLPFSILLAACSRDIVALLFQRGAFDTIAVEHTALALSAFAFGLAGVCARNLFSYAFFALQQARFLVLVNAAALSLYLVLAMALMRPFSFAGLALAYSIGAWVEFAALAVALRRRLAPSGGIEIGATFAKPLICTCLMLAALRLLHGQIGALFTTRSPISEIGSILTFCTAGTAAYFFSAWVLGVEEARGMWDKFLEVFRQ